MPENLDSDDLLAECVHKCNVNIFRMVVQSHRCQLKELIFGRTTQSVEDYNFFPTVQVVPSSAGGRLRDNTFVRMR